MRALILAAGAALTLSACGGGGGEAAAENNTLAVETLDVGNLVVNDPAAMTGDATLDVNAAGNAATANNMVVEDLTTNSPDTNLANGL